MKEPAQVKASIQNNKLEIIIGGNWCLDNPWPSQAGQILSNLETTHYNQVVLSTNNLDHWDSSLLLFLYQIAQLARSKKISIESDLPDGLNRLLNLVFAVPPRIGASRTKTKENFIEKTGEAVLNAWPELCDFFAFLGEIVFGLKRLATGKTKMRRKDLFTSMYECGVSSLPIISLTSMLFGLILAFVGAVQLTQFGAQIYVAGLVGIGMLRVMGAVMVGIVMSGRIGAAYAAMIGTMQVNEEVDALEVLGISPIDFLVMPRMLGLAIMAPILTVYADFMGLVGGYLVGTFMLGLNSLEYIHATEQMVLFKQVLIGLVYGTVFGIVIAICGCYQGMKCGRSAMAVGQTTTKAVVASLVGIIVMTAIITIIFNVIGI